MASPTQPKKLDIDALRQYITTNYSDGSALTSEGEKYLRTLNKLEKEQSGPDGVRWEIDPETKTFRAKKDGETVRTSYGARGVTGNELFSNKNKERVSKLMAIGAELNKEKAKAEVATVTEPSVNINITPTAEPKKIDVVLDAVENAKKQATPINTTVKEKPEISGNTNTASVTPKVEEKFEVKDVITQPKKKIKIEEGKINNIFTGTDAKLFADKTPEEQAEFIAKAFEVEATPAMITALNSVNINTTMQGLNAKEAVLVHQFRKLIGKAPNKLEVDAAAYNKELHALKNMGAFKYKNNKITLTLPSDKEKAYKENWIEILNSKTMAVPPRGAASKNRVNAMKNWNSKERDLDMFLSEKLYGLEPTKPYTNIDFINKVVKPAFQKKYAITKNAKGGLIKKYQVSAGQSLTSIGQLMQNNKANPTVVDPLTAQLTKLGQEQADVHNYLKTLSREQQDDAMRHPKYKDVANRLKWLQDRYGTSVNVPEAYNATTPGSTVSNNVSNFLTNLVNFNSTSNSSTPPVNTVAGNSSSVAPTVNPASTVLPKFTRIETKPKTLDRIPTEVDTLPKWRFDPTLPNFVIADAGNPSANVTQSVIGNISSVLHKIAPNKTQPVQPNNVVVNTKSGQEGDEIYKQENPPRNLEANINTTGVNVGGMNFKYPDIISAILARKQYKNPVGFANRFYDTAQKVFVPGVRGEESFDAALSNAGKDAIARYGQQSNSADPTLNLIKGIITGGQQRQQELDIASKSVQVSMQERERKFNEQQAANAAAVEQINQNIATSNINKERDFNMDVMTAQNKQQRQRDYYNALINAVSNTVASNQRDLDFRKNIAYSTAQDKINVDKTSLNTAKTNLNYQTSRLDNINQNIMALESEIASGRLTPEQVALKNKQLSDLKTGKSSLESEVDTLKEQINTYEASLNKYYKDPLQAYDAVQKEMGPTARKNSVIIDLVKGIKI